MNDILNNFLLARNIFMPETHVRQPRFSIVCVDHLLKAQKEHKN